MATIELGVKEVLLASKGPQQRSVKCRIKLPAGMISTTLETPSVNVVSASHPVRLDWVHKLQCTQGQQAWTALKNALEIARSSPGAAKIEFILVDASSHKDMGSAAVNLATLIGASSEKDEQTLYAEDSARRALGTLVVRVRALDSVRAVQGGVGAKHGDANISEDVRRAFKQFDSDGSGDIDSKELLDALKMLGMDASSIQARQILSRYTVGSRNTLGLPEFAKLVADLKAHTGKDPTTPTGKSPARGGGGMDAASVKAAFDAFDIDCTGDIDAKELRGALKKLGMDVNARDTEAVLRRYVTGGKQTLSLHDFDKLVHDLRAYTGKDHVAPVSAARSTAPPASAHDSTVDPNIRTAFMSFDLDNSGGIDKNELVEALQHLGMSSNSARAQQIINKYAGAGVREINLAQFGKLVRDLEKFQGGSTPILRTKYAYSQIDPKITAAFEAFDTDRSGGIDENELLSALYQLGMQATAASAREVMRKYDTVNKDGTLDIFEFDCLVRDLNAFRGGAPIGHGNNGGGGGRVEPRIQAAFDRFDTDGNHYIDQYELQLALKELGMDASAAQVRKVLTKYDDRNVDGRLDVYEFERLVNGHVDDHVGFQGRSGGGTYVDPAKIDARVRSAFERFDTDRNGSIDAHELRSALHHLGVEADSEQSERVLRRYDPDRTGGIELREFARLVADLIEHQAGGDIPHEVRKAFATFDHDRSGTIDACELTRALQALGIEARSSEAGIILRQYDADGNRSLDLNEFARLVGDIRDFQEGGRRDAISAQLKRIDIIALFSQHRLALDELFRAYATFAASLDPRLLATP